MSANCKMLKIMSLIQILAGVGAGVLAFISFTMPVAEDASGLAAAKPAIVGVLYFLSGLLSIAAAFSGIRGANKPRVLGYHDLISALAAGAGAIVCVLAGFTNGIPFAALAVVFLGIAGAHYGRAAAKEQQL